MLEPLFIVSLGLLTYVYVGYPIALATFAHFFGSAPTIGVATPSVTIVAAAHQEATVIGEKLANFATIDYPADRLNMLIVSDESTDGTDEIIEGNTNTRIRLIRQTPRAGKASALNLALEHIDTEVVVFTDANVLFDAQAVARLVAPLADEDVGIVTGVVHLIDDKAGYSESEGAYYRYERFLQQTESHLWSVVGVDGALFAAKRQLVISPPPDAILDDFVMSMAVACQGKRIIYEPSAVAYENAAPTQADEFRRKVRVGVGAFQSIARRWSLPSLTQGRLGFCYVSHKVLRWLSPWFLLGALLANVGIVSTQTASVSNLWIGLLAAQCTFYLSASLGLLLPGLRNFRLVSIPMYFCMMNAAFAVGLVRFLTQGSSGRWKPTARTPLKSEGS